MYGYCYRLAFIILNGFLESYSETSDRININYTVYTSLKYTGTDDLCISNMTVNSLLIIVIIIFYRYISMLTLKWTLVKFLLYTMYICHPNSF